jgi:DEAD/DEAH box helicase domain-containing protein
MQSDLLAQTSALIASCDCETGCPMCVGPIGETGPLAKTVALRILQHLMSPALEDGSGKRAVAVPAEEVPF